METVLRSETAEMNVVPAAGRHVQSPTTRIKTGGAIGTQSKEFPSVAEVTPPNEANRTIPRIELVSTTVAPTPRKNANVAIVKIMRSKIVKCASNVVALGTSSG